MFSYLLIRFFEKNTRWQVNFFCKLVPACAGMTDWWQTGSRLRGNDAQMLEREVSRRRGVRHSLERGKLFIAAPPLFFCFAALQPSSPRKRGSANPNGNPSLPCGATTVIPTKVGTSQPPSKNRSFACSRFCLIYIFL